MATFRMKGLSAIAALFAFSIEAGAAAPRLPPTAPRPTASPHRPAEITGPPRPEPRPDTEQTTTEASKAPLPEPHPAPDAPPAPATGDTPRSETPPVATEELACRSRLRARGVEFAEHAPVSEPLGCAIPHPLTLRSLGSGVKLNPEAVLNCATAEAAVKFTAEVIAPAAKSTYGVALAAIGHGSAYVCRPRNGTTKLSEHAFGNALDIGSFSLADGRSIAVTATSDPKDADFLARVRMPACGPFKTVLGP
ncbi:extensin family protein, partial [Rhizobiaceae sp. 2RAB30]